MTSKSSTRSIAATQKGQQTLRTAQKDNDGEYLSYPKIAEKAGVSRSTVERFFSGKSVDVPFASWITEALELDLADVVDIRQLESFTGNSDTQQSVTITRHTFQAMLDKQRELTSNPFTDKQGKIFSHSEMYVPLGVVERINKEPKRSHDEGFPLQGSQLYQEKEQVTPIEHEQFFEQVLRKGETSKSNGKRIAITGEAGAGKTTQLQKIADWVLTETEDMVVWVSLADLQGRSLEDYLLQVWLKNAFNLNPGGVTDAMENALVERFNEGKVWLLLDGVDEMGVNNPLFEIYNQLQGWIASARVVLTCRLNVWDMGKNYLTDFDVYRNLDFSELQRQEFIKKYFSEESQRGKNLETELKKPGKERIRDLVRNPLRLTLLCYSWERHEGQLPETKAGLYEWFVETFYEWKEERFSTTSEQRNELNKALGELAKQAIDQPSSRFRLTHHQVCEVLGETDEPLFNLAIEIGWLNKVGVAEENPNEPVYAFFHPTFQEYFAALAIDDWDFFLNHVPDDPEQGIYRIFEAKWEEVFLLWLGRRDITTKTKESILESLFDFKISGEEDALLGLTLYCYRSLFVASLGIAEIATCEISKKLTTRLAEVAFGYFDSETQNWSYHIPFFQSEAKELLYLTPKKTTIEVLLESFNHECMPIYCDTVSLFINSLSRQNTKLVSFLSNLISSVSDTELQRVFEEREFLSEFLIDVAEVLEYIDPNNITANSFLESYYIPRPERKFSKGVSLVEMERSASKPQEKNRYIQSLRRENIDNNDPVQKLKLSLENCPGDPHTVVALVQEIQKGRTLYMGQAISLVVNEVTKFKHLLPLVVQVIFEMMKEDNFSLEIYNLLWHCAQNMSYPDFYKAWHSQPTTIQTLEQHFIDLASQLQPTATTHPIVIDLGTLAGETDSGEIIQEFCYQINQAVCSEKKIPTVNKVSSLKNVFIEQLKTHLQVKNIVFVLQNEQPYPELVTLCKRLVNAVHIGYVTDQKVDPDFRGFYPAQPNLVTVVQNWINGLG